MEALLGPGRPVDLAVCDMNMVRALPLLSCTDHATCSACPKLQWAPHMIERDLLAPAPRLPVAPGAGGADAAGGGAHAAGGRPLGAYAQVFRAGARQARRCLVFLLREPSLHCMHGMPCCTPLVLSYPSHAGPADSQQQRNKMQCQCRLCCRDAWQAKMEALLAPEWRGVRVVHLLANTQHERTCLAVRSGVAA